VTLGAVRIPVPKFSVPSPTRDASGTVAAMALYAGESVGAVTEVAAAGDVVRELAEGAERLLHAKGR
jgi:nitronate monooxygenase